MPHFAEAALFKLVYHHYAAGSKSKAFRTFFHALIFKC
jgi:hypothetical protein